MTYIMVDKSKFKSLEGGFRNLSKNLGSIHDEITSIGGRLDWDIRAEADIDRIVKSIATSISQQSALLNSMSLFLSTASQKYEKLDEEFVTDLDKFKNYSTVTPGNVGITGEISKYFGITWDIAKDAPETIKRLLDFKNKFLPGLVSITSGFMIKKVGDKFIVYGKRTASNKFEKLYLKWRTGTEKEGGLGIKLNTTTSKDLLAGRPWANALNNIKDDFKDNFKKLGAVGNLFTIGSNIYDYGWGKEKNEGLLSSGFLSSLTVDLGKGIVQGAVAEGAGAFATSLLASAATDAAVGTVVPGVGTAVGFTVGLGLAIADQTPWGKTATNWTKDQVKGIYHKVGDYIGGWSKNLFNW